MKKAQAGSVESNDVLITVSESDTLEINISEGVLCSSMEGLGEEIDYEWAAN